MIRGEIFRESNQKVQAHVDRLLRPLRVAHERLTPREKKLVRLLLSLVGGIVLWQGVTLVFWDPYQAREAELADLRSETLKVATLAREIESSRALIQAQAQRLAREERGFSLISTLEEEADKAHIKSRITRMTPRTLPPEGSYRIAMVSLEIDSVDLPHALVFLARIQRSPHFIRVTRLSMKRRFNDHSKIDLSLDVEAVQPS